MASPVNRSKPNTGFFANGYLTLTSLIQATAFGMLVYSIEKLTATATALAVERLPYLACEFATIAVVTWTYFAGSRDLTWRLGGLDIVIPLSLGLCQNALILMASREQCDPFAWFLCFLVFSLLGGAAVTNAWVKTRRNPSSHAELKVQKERLFAGYAASCYLQAVYCAVVCVLLHSAVAGQRTAQCCAILLACEQAALLVCASFWTRANPSLRLRILRGRDLAIAANPPRVRTGRPQQQRQGA